MWEFMTHMHLGRLLLSYHLATIIIKIMFILVQHVREQLPMSSLSSHFRQCAHPLLVGVSSDEMMDSLCEQLVLKISHTMSNDFLRNVSTLENLKENKAVDAQMSLRDELKTYASHTKSSFHASSY